MASQLESRRRFIKHGAGAFGAACLGLSLPQVLLAAEAAAENHQAKADYKNISPSEARELRAIVDQIIPEDDTPGASELGVVYFIDTALGDFMAGPAPMLRQGLDELQQATQSAHPGAERFSALSFTQQTVLLKSMEDAPFFGMLQFLTLCGMFSMPAYGGNKDHQGWELLGFSHQHVWQPPFGHYDAEAHGTTRSQEGDHEHS